jgi:hypothetical protein
MRLVFVHHVIADRGSAQDMFNYAQVAEALGHEVVLYGRPGSNDAFKYSREVRPADAVIFIFEWTTELQFGDHLDLLRLVARVPRRRRVVIDCDGNYNDAISVVGDVNHRDAAHSQQWVAVCDSLSDKIVQPTFHPLRPNVKTFFFHAYNPAWERPLDFHRKDYDVIYVGNNWYRWRGLQRVLDALEPIRDRVGRVGLIGHGWDCPAPWTSAKLIPDAYQTDAEYLQRLGVEVMPPVKFDEVIDCMGRGVLSPVLLRPLFDHLRLVTCRNFETPAANTIPLFAQDAAYVSEIYGGAALELLLPDDRPQEMILDVSNRPQHYAEIVQGIRGHLGQRHSYAARLRELIDIVES